EALGAVAVAHCQAQWVLVGALSNPDLQDLFKSLTSQRRRKQRRTQSTSSDGPRPDGRRRFGTVSGAIVQVLAEAQSDLRAREIWAEVERLLGSSVSRHSIKSYLHRGSYGSTAMFERVNHGGYRLRKLSTGSSSPRTGQDGFSPNL